MPNLSFSSVHSSTKTSNQCIKNSPKSACNLVKSLLKAIDATHSDFLLMIVKEKSIWRGQQCWQNLYLQILKLQRNYFSLWLHLKDKHMKLYYKIFLKCYKNVLPMVNRCDLHDHVLQIVGSTTSSKAQLSEGDKM